MNILTFDTEEWYLEAVLHGGRPKRMAEFDETFDHVLSLLAEVNAKATFFCLGRIASEYPQVVRRIVDAGHDIGCHSDKHDWLTKMSPEELRRDTVDALHALEDVSGRKVTSFRAPAFSITPENRWAVEVLAECGIETDASIFPAVRDFGGYPRFPQDTPCRISCNGAVLKEYPVPIMSLLGKRIAFSGGGYFRLFPYGMVKKEMNRRPAYNMCYFHLADLIPAQVKMMNRAEFEDYFGQPGTLKNRAVRYVKSNIGSGDALGKLSRLLREIPFTSIAAADAEIDWTKTNLIKL